MSWLSEFIVVIAAWSSAAALWRIAHAIESVTRAKGSSATQGSIKNERG